MRNSFLYSKNATEVRNCYLHSLNDLKVEKDYVRDKIAEYANDLLGLGTIGPTFVFYYNTANAFVLMLHSTCI